MLKKGDYIVLLCIAVISLSALVTVNVVAKNGRTVIIKQDGKTVYSESLSKDNVVELENNTVVIKDSFAYVEKASCKNQICVKHTPINKSGEIIICLPNKVTVEIK